jgi:imidazolonepropionase-like amidohydrolase
MTVFIGIGGAALTTVAFAQAANAPRNLQPAAPIAASGHAQTAAANRALPAGPATLIRHGHLYTAGAAGTVNDGDVLIQGGKIVQVGPNLSPPDGAKIVNAKSRPVTPGLMASWTQLGIDEVDLVAETNDTSANQKIDSAAFDVADALNPNSTLIPVARIAGVTRSLTAPTACGEVFCGTAAVIHLGYGPDLIVKRQAGVLVDLEPTGGSKQANARPDIWAKFRETLEDAREYLAQRSGYHRPGGARDQRSTRIDLDALGPVIQGQEPLIVRADRASTIRQIVQYAQGAHLKLILVGGGEAWEVAHDLAEAQVPVVIDPETNLPASFSDLGATLRGAARLDAAGVTVVLQPQSNDPSHYARTITQIAGNAVANGMRWDHALAAITRNPAQVWGIADQYGTLEPGKDADVVIWDGDPLNVTSAPTAVFIRGQNIPLVSRQTKLRDRYRDLKHKDPPFAYR